MNQRQIKFRAWGVNSKEYLVNGRGITLQEIQAILDITTWEFEQFTGILDKNGKEVYEGDILRTSDTGNLFEVIFDDKAASFKIVERSETYAKNRKWMMGWDVKRREVVGNIHENPELIKP